MGNRASHKKAAQPITRARKPVVSDYVYQPVRKRPKSSKSWRDAQYILTLGQQGRSATMSDIDKIENPDNPPPEHNHPIPRWQSKWELDMRPDPRDISSTLKSRAILRPWKSMQVIPTIEKQSTHNTPNRSPGTTRSFSRRGRRRRSLSFRASIGSARRSALPVPDVEESYDKVSVVSMQIDGFKMLYKSDERTDSALDLTAKLWHFQPKKHNKEWFLSDVHHTKQETHPSEIIVPKKVKPYTSIIKTVHRPMPMFKQDTIREQPETIKEED